MSPPAPNDEPAPDAGAYAGALPSEAMGPSSRRQPAASPSVAREVLRVSILGALALGALTMPLYTPLRIPSPSAVGEDTQAHVQGEPRPHRPHPSSAASESGAPDFSRHTPEGASSSAGTVTPEATFWRVSHMEEEAGMDVVEGMVGKRPLGSALVAAGISRKESVRAVRALGTARKFDKLPPGTEFCVAKNIETNQVAALEVALPTGEIWQASTDDSGQLVGKKLELSVDRRAVAVAAVVTDSLRNAVARAGLHERILRQLDEALDGHVDLSQVRPGSRFRIVATEERVQGKFSRYATLDAAEYQPAHANSAPLRVYWFDSAAADEGRNKKKPRDAGYFDAKGQHPFPGPWKRPVPGAPVSSRFNPQRLHPVLKVVMPHNGVDFAALTGTPILSTAAGTIVSVGDAGPCGNMVKVRHAGTLSSIYCHMSKFAPGIHVGQRVEARQLIGYVGATGRVTGPHLHFGMLNGDTFIDPFSLKMEGMQSVSAKHKDLFQRRRIALDAELDRIPLPARGKTMAPHADAGDQEPIYELPDKPDGGR